jgi:D-beta-D-heptose 7-phosphate kinase/D-beta-D-heptose 1-phosphate adenosyltransferase
MQLPDFSEARVLVAGDLMLDRYWHGGTSRISPEAPVPVVKVEEIEDRPGGAGNVALNLTALGCQVQLLGYCGSDDAGTKLIALLEGSGIRCGIDRAETLPTITKLRVLSRHQQLIRLDFEQRFHDLDQTALLNRFASGLDCTKTVVLSDYGKGTLTQVPEFIRLARAAGKPVLADPKGTDFHKYRGASVITPNRSEFEAIAGACPDDRTLVERGWAMLETLELEALLITRGEQGMTLLQNGAAARHLPAHAKEVYDVTGAGDTVISVLAGALAAGASLSDATQLANVAAGIVVGKVGTASVNRQELNLALRGIRADRHGVLELDQLLPVVAAARRRGERIVATNGCFDILHPGHLTYLRDARGLGDRLVVLVNSDDSVRRLKGRDRPVNPLDHRMAMLAGLECVDWVVPFDNDTPREEIGALLPDVLVKGGDYHNVEDIAGHDCVLANGGQVKLLGFLEGYSTSRIIDAIRGD